MAMCGYFPVWDKLTDAERAALDRAAVWREVPAGTLLHNGSADCVGLFVICTGQLRVYILSDEGREVTLYRLFERDISLFSAACMLSSLQFDVCIEAEKDATLWNIPPEAYRQVMEGSAVLANYTNQLMADRLTQIMWLVEQIMWKSMDKRLATFLLEESSLERSDTLKLTHDRIAAHLGTAREVVTRMLRYFQTEGMVALSRGSVRLLQPERLQQLAE